MHDWNDFDNRPPSQPAAAKSHEPEADCRSTAIQRRFSPTDTLKRTLESTPFDNPIVFLINGAID
jgi:hypothetical protein